MPKKGVENPVMRRLRSASLSLPFLGFMGWPLRTLRQRENRPKILLVAEHFPGWATPPHHFLLPAIRAHLVNATSSSGATNSWQPKPAPPRDSWREAYPVDSGFPRCSVL